MTDVTRLSVGDPAPPFTLPDATGTPVSLADFAGRQVIVYFYPAAMTPGWPVAAGQGRIRGRRNLTGQAREARPVR